ncbi:MAG: T9SS type A sorting domain-containing protein [Bacteroidetes bacterium]|nr:T9SS type A sorting domain-containing protein [Bacteroidota bacterium]
MMTVLCCSINVLQAQEQMRVQWSTFLGGSGRDEARDLCVDDSDNVYVCGVFASTDFPSPRGNGSSDASGPGYVARLDANGRLRWMQWIAGVEPHEVCVSSDGFLVVAASATVGSNTLAGPQPGAVGSKNAAIVAFSTAGERLGSYVLGGVGEDIATSVDIAREMIFIGGITSSTDFPVSANASQRTYGGDGSTGQGIGDGFVAKVRIRVAGPSATLSPLVVSYLGGRYLDEILCLRVNNSLGGLYVAGRTRSDNLPGQVNIQQRVGTEFDDDGFVCRLDTFSLFPQWTMYCGGQGNDVIYSIQPYVVIREPSGNVSVDVRACGLFNGGDVVYPGQPSYPSLTYRGGTRFGGDAFGFVISNFFNLVTSVSGLQTTLDDWAVAMPRNNGGSQGPLLFSNGEIGPFGPSVGINAYIWNNAIPTTAPTVVTEFEAPGDEAVLDDENTRFGFGGRAVGRNGEYICGTTSSASIPGTDGSAFVPQTSSGGGLDGYIVKIGCSLRQSVLRASNKFLCSSSDSSVLSLDGDVTNVTWSDGTSGQSTTVRSPGLYRVRYSVLYGCNEYEDSILISAGRLPSAVLEPTQDRTLCAGDSLTVRLANKVDVDSIAWNGGTMGTTDTLVVKRPGTYVATLRSADGCTMQTNTVTVREYSLPPSTTLLLDIVGGEAHPTGATVRAILRISTSPSLPIEDYPIAWTAVVSVDATVLFPRAPLPIGVVSGSVRTMRVSGLRASSSDTLGVLTFTAALGETDTSVIRVDSVEFTACGERTGPTQTTMVVSNICNADSTKRFVSTRQVRLAVQIAPNPSTGGNATISVFSEDRSATTIQLFDLLGVAVATAPAIPAQQHLELCIPSDLPTGTYVVVVRCGEQMTTRMLEVLK